MVEELTLVKLRTQEVLPMDKTTVPGYILKSVDWGSIEGSHKTYKYLDQVGTSLVNTTLGTRPISIEGWIVSQHPRDMSERKAFLNRFVNPQDPIELRYSGYKISFSPDSTVRYSINYEDNNDVISKFQITGIAHDPMFTDESQTRMVFATTTSKFKFPFIASTELPNKGVLFGTRTGSLIASVVNKGSVPTGMRILFRAKGTLRNPVLINVDTQEFLRINKVMLAEEEVEINTTVGNKSVKGRLSPEDPLGNYFAYRDLDSSWLQLLPGKNLFRYDADSGLDNLEVFVYFQNRFLEVQECY